MKLTNEAKGRECQIRIPGVCNHDRDTVVLCHLNNKRLFNVGMGQKVPDIAGAWACSACHDVVDSRNNWADAKVNFSPAEIQIMFHEGIFRTQAILLKEEKIKF